MPLLGGAQRRFIPHGRLWLCREDYKRWRAAEAANTDVAGNEQSAAPLSVDTTSPLDGLGELDDRGHPSVKVQALPSSGDEMQGRLARRLLMERQLRGWSLAKAAAASGVSKAMISKIERNEANATTGLLGRLAAAYDLSLATLLAGAERRGAVVRRALQPQWEDAGSGQRRRQVFSLMNHPIELVEVVLPSRSEGGFPVAVDVLRHRLIWVLEGVLSIVHGDEALALQAGDCLPVDPAEKIAVENSSQAECRYVVVAGPGRS